MESVGPVRLGLVLGLVIALVVLVVVARRDPDRAEPRTVEPSTDPTPKV